LSLPLPVWETERSIQIVAKPATPGFHGTISGTLDEMSEMYHFYALMHRELLSALSLSYWLVLFYQ